jgi:DNA-binding transcriptional LysR family regulator
MSATIRDLSLLHPLDALLQEESVTAAAKRALLTTPAMSRALGRLREALADPLLVRAGGRMVLTPYAVALRERAHAARAEANAVLGPATHASLEHLERTLVIRASDAVAGLIAAPLAARLAAEAPRLTVHFAPEGDEDAAALRDGRVDIDIGVADLAEPELRTRVLFRDSFTFVVRRGHPLERGRLTEARLAAAPHVAVTRAGRPRGPIDHALEAAGHSRRIAAVVPTFFAALFAAARSDLVAAVPRTLATEASTVLPLRVLRAPIVLPPIAISLLWHPRLDHDPAHRWLRERVLQLTPALTSAARTRSRSRPSRRDEG